MIYYSVQELIERLTNSYLHHYKNGLVFHSLVEKCNLKTVKLHTFTFTNNIYYG